MSFMNDTLGVSGLTSYLKEKKSLWLVLAVLVLGVCLMLFGGASEDGGTDDASLEARIERLCERVTGASDISVMVRTDSVGEVRGVAVVCRGGEDANVRLTVTEMLTALFGIPSSAVSVVGGK